MLVFISLESGVTRVQISEAIASTAVKLFTAR